MGQSPQFPRGIALIGLGRFKLPVNSHSQYDQRVWGYAESTRGIPSA